MCCDSSSTISASRAASSRRGSSRRRISALQSGMLHPRDAIDGRHELLPATAVREQQPFAFGGDAVIAAAPLPGLLDPAALDERAAFHAIEQRVERRDVESKDAARSRLDELGELVSVPRLMLEERQRQQLRAPFLHLALDGHGCPIYVCHTYTQDEHERSRRVMMQDSQRRRVLVKKEDA